MQTARIHQLDAGVINKIAAGEVIERPASVVKELLENSIDALATRVEVDIAGGGADLIRIVDDGEGIHPDDLYLAVTSHATSKIEQADDLFSVRTMGFRGEALASIAEVSRFRIRSRQADAEAGVELEVNAGRAGKLQVCGCPLGTLVEVQQLFANTPVRRKFLKTTATEFGHISEQFTRIALGHPRLHMVLRHNQKMVYELPATGSLLDRIELFYGGKLAEGLIGVESQVGDIRLWGYVGHPKHSKSTRKGQYLFLNGRWIQDRSLQHALTEAYRGLLMVGRQPIAFLFLEMPADQLDVNVHPTKSEVRFVDSQRLYRQLLSMLRTKFLGMDLDSDLQIRGGARSGGNDSEPPVSPAVQRELQMELASWAKQQLTSEGPAPDFVPPPVVLPPPSGQLSLSGRAHSDEAGEAVRADHAEPTPAGAHISDWGRSSDTPGNDQAGQGDAPGLAAGTNETSEGAESGGGLAEAAAAAANARAVWPEQRAMQVHDCYLVVATDEGLTVIDQHALHERVMYEQLRKRVLAGSVEAQRLLVPETIELGAREASLLLENQELLSQLGFGIEEFGGSTILLTAYPVMLAKANFQELIRDIADQLEGSGQKPTRRDLLDELLHMMSCKAAVKAGQRLTPEEMDSLLQQRHLIDDAHHCPHGRPTALVLSRNELDRQFGRLG
jgi:DNA mismatch repair protein MutL